MEERNECGQPHTALHIYKHIAFGMAFSCRFQLGDSAVHTIKTGLALYESTGRDKGMIDDVEIHAIWYTSVNVNIIGVFMRSMPVSMTMPSHSSITPTPNDFELRSTSSVRRGVGHVLDHALRLWRASARSVLIL